MVLGHTCSQRPLVGLSDIGETTEQSHGEGGGVLRYLLLQLPRLLLELRGLGSVLCTPLGLLLQVLYLPEDRNNNHNNGVIPKLRVCWFCNTILVTFL